MKKVVGILMVMIVGIILSGCSDNPQDAQESASTEQTVQAKVEVILKEDDKEISSKSIDFKDGDSLYDVMKNNFEIKDDNGFITSIDGHTQNQDQQKYWMYTVNGEEATTGAKELKVKNGDEIVFNLAGMK
ncbi:DUF4430 domain-containing protein [Enterococcus mediterraneensis]|uniref:DUF4430 domain-containing protein n=1 Tax=Enterococcus mediterraneensis TaxID=2364791 RepID=UPI000F0608DE|nr:DUF4430 domain-containing protein [Enterococcus mediterraneensis]